MPSIEFSARANLRPSPDPQQIEALQALASDALHEEIESLIKSQYDTPDQGSMALSEFEILGDSTKIDPLEEEDFAAVHYSGHGWGPGVDYAGNLALEIRQPVELDGGFNMVDIFITASAPENSAQDPSYG